MSTNIILGKLQNNAWLVYVFGIFFWQVVCDLTNFQRRILKQLVLNSKAVNMCEDKKRRQSVPVLKLYLGKFGV